MEAQKLVSTKYNNNKKEQVMHHVVQASAAADPTKLRPTAGTSQHSQVSDTQSRSDFDHTQCPGRQVVEKQTIIYFSLIIGVSRSH